MTPPCKADGFICRVASGGASPLWSCIDNPEVYCSYVIKGENKEALIMTPRQLAKRIERTGETMVLDVKAAPKD